MAKTRGMLAALQGAGKGETAVAARPAPSPLQSDSEPREEAAPQRRKREGRSGSSNPSREGRVNVTGYFDPAVKQSIRMIQAKFPQRLTEQDLLAEALNDLFAKYQVPQTASTPRS